MGFALPLQPGGTLEVARGSGVWRFVQAGAILAELAAPGVDGTTVTATGDGRPWTVSGTVIPLEMTLWDEVDGAGAAWCQGRTLRRGAAVQVAGVEPELTVHAHLLGHFGLDADDGPVTELRAKHRKGGLALRFELADRLDVAAFAPGIALVAAWRVLLELVPQAGTMAVGP